MRPLGLSPVAFALCIALTGCASGSKQSAAGTQPQPTPVAPDSTMCAEPGTNGTLHCSTSQELLATPALQEAAHDLRRLGMVTDMEEVGHGRVALKVTDEGMAQYTPLAYHLEHLYRAYRIAYDYGDVVVFELWHRGRLVGSYASQGLLLR